MALAQSFLEGLASGGHGLLTLPLLPGELVTPEGQHSPLEKFEQAVPPLKEPKEPWDKAAYLFGQGGGVGTAFGGPYIGLAAGLLNAGVGLMTEDPTLRLGLGLATAPLAPAGAVLKARQGPLLQAEASSVTKVPVTQGQKFGKEAQLRTEAWLRSHPEGASFAREFDLSQATAMESFFKNMQKFNQNANLTPTQIRDASHSAYSSYFNTLLSNYRKTNNKNFEAAKAAGADTQIGLNKTTKAVDNIISSLDPTVAGNAEKIKYFTSIRDKMADKQSVNIDSLQQHLASWGGAVGTGKFINPVDKLAIGVDTHHAFSVLNALRDDLGAAVRSGAPGAKELLAARNDMSKNATALRAFAEMPLTKYFKGDVSRLVPEDVVAKLGTLPNSQKTELMSVLSSTNPGLAEAVRQTSFMAIMKGAQRPGAAFGEANISMSALLDNFGKIDKEQIAYLFPSTKEQNSFYAAMDDLRRINRTPYGSAVAGVNHNAKTAQETAGAAFGATGKYGLQALQDAWGYVTGLPPAKQAAMIFSTDGRKAVRELSNGEPAGFIKFLKGTGAIGVGVGSGGLEKASELRQPTPAIAEAPDDMFPTGNEAPQPVPDIQSIPDEAFPM